jgi:hypothetical protein
MNEPRPELVRAVIPVFHYKIFGDKGHHDAVQSASGIRKPHELGNVQLAGIVGDGLQNIHELREGGSSLYLRSFSRPCRSGAVMVPPRRK